MNMFSRKTDPVSVLRRDLRSAIDNADPAQVTVLLAAAKDIDVPLDVLGQALQRAVEKRQARISETLLKAGAPVRFIAMGTARTIILEERQEMFRLLTQHGLDFALRSANADTEYKLHLRFLQKDLECTQVREAFQQLRDDVTRKTSLPPESLPQLPPPAPQKLLL